MAPTAITRIMSDIAHLHENPILGVFVPDPVDLFNFDAAIAGPDETPYEGGFFPLRVKIPCDFPDQPPMIRFKSKVFHPNISESGTICVDLLEVPGWTPAIRIGQALEALRGLLGSPNEASPLNLNAALMMRSNMEMFRETATTWTYHFATGPRSIPHHEDKIAIVMASIDCSLQRALKRLSINEWNVNLAIDV